MTTKQSYAIYLKTGYDIRGINVPQETINQIFSASIPDSIEIVKGLGGIFKRLVNLNVETKEDKYNKFEKIYNEAHDAGMKAVQNLKVIPMFVTQHLNPIDDKSEVVESWYVEDGVCGFAWINVKPGTSSFAKWLVEKKIASHDSYYGGVTIWVSDFGQSMQKKEAYAHAFSSILNNNEIKSYAMSRMD